MKRTMASLRRISFTSRSRRLTISRGVARGAISPSQPTASKPCTPGTPDSATAGTSGSRLDRRAEVTAKGTARPERMCGSAAVIESTISGTWPPRKSDCAGPCTGGGQDRKRISVTQEHELRDWSKKFGVMPDELKKQSLMLATVQKKVEQHFRDRKGAKRAGER
jgi:hypothetical protein